MDGHLADQPRRLLSHAGAGAPGLAGEACVVVPTRDRAGALERCLAALRASAGGAGARLELICADDGSREPSAVASVAERHGARLLRLGGDGPAAARNAGARASERPVILFCDDDCRPAPAWAPRLLARIESGADVLAGRTVSPPGASAPVRGGQAITNSLLLGSLNRPGPRLGFAPSCNLGVRRAVLERVAFDESFPTAAGEDRDWCDRVTAAGLEIAYEPRAVVVHAPDLNGRRFLRQQWGYGRGAVRYRRAAPRRGVAPAAFWHELTRASRAEGAQVATLLAAGQLATAAGALAEAVGGRDRE